MPRRPATHADHGADVLSLNEAACRLGIHPDTYKKGVRLGQLPGVTFGSTYIVPRKWFERLCLGDWRPHVQQEEAA